MAEPVRSLPYFDNIDDFLDWVVVQEMPFELVDGHPVPKFGDGPTAMAGVEPAHDAIVVNAIVQLGRRLDGTRCQVHSPNRGVRVAGRRFRLPDVAVSCVPQPNRYLTEPVLVVEVVSPSTERVDRTTKLDEYRGLPSLRHYLMLDQDRPRALLYTRRPEGGWLFDEIEGVDAELDLTGLGLRLPLAALYAGVAFDVGEAS